MKALLAQWAAHDGLWSVDAARAQERRRRRLTGSASRPPSCAKQPKRVHDFGTRIHPGEYLANIDCAGERWRRILLGHVRAQLSEEVVRVSGRGSSGSFGSGPAPTHRPTAGWRLRVCHRGRSDRVVMIAGFSLGSARVFSGFLPGHTTIFLGLWDLICAF